MTGPFRRLLTFRLACVWVAIVALLLSARSAMADSLLAANPTQADFQLSSEDRTAVLYVEKGSDSAVSRAANDFAADVDRVTTRRPALVDDPSSLSGDVVLVGVCGKSPVIDALVAAGKLDVTGLKGSWETFLVATVDAPLPNVRRALVVVGSDRRGAIYGLYELSAAIGVSPWYWWADVAPVHQKRLAIAAGQRRFGPPSVKYRGIFINDEDWGLQPWAASVFEPEHRGIGPKTYAKVFELLLRLKANILWPAMHACSPAFNAFPENAALADGYGIVMGSSHAEPMLRNNVSEWKEPAAQYNYLTNRDGVLQYWESRVAANGRFESIYTLGMRGIHDSSMIGPKTDAERIQTLEQIFEGQRELLARHIRSDLEHVPQIFCAYKEVLPLYRGGLKVPDDVTVMFPDDNFGYIRAFPAPSDRRTGGFGIYYHLSYLGAPMSYLWLCTTPPALIWEEMTKAYRNGADKIWIANVGDVKPGEIGMEFFLDLAWNAHRWDDRDPGDFLNAWAEREFGKDNASEIGSILRSYYLLNYQRKPEHLQWWMPQRKPAPSPLTLDEIHDRLGAFAALRTRTEAIAAKIPSEKRDAFFELVEYPVHGSALANERYLYGELSTRDANPDANLAARAEAADTQLKEQTRRFNDQISGGKWRGIMSLEPADRQWHSIRLDPWVLPKFSAPQPVAAAAQSSEVIARDAGHYDRKKDRPAARWQLVPGLGRTGRAVVVLPFDAPSVASERLSTESPSLEYDLNFSAGGDYVVSIHLLPAQPLRGSALRFAIGLDQAPPQPIAFEVKDGSSEWAQGVLNAVRIASAPLTVPAPGQHTLSVYMIDPGVVIDKLVLAPKQAPAETSYLGPIDRSR